MSITTKEPRHLVAGASAADAHLDTAIDALEKAKRIVSLLGPCPASVLIKVINAIDETKEARARLAVFAKRIP